MLLRARPVGRTLSIAAYLLAVCVLFVLASPHAAAAAARPGVVAGGNSLIFHPSDVHGKSPLGSGYFKITAPAGATVHLHVALGTTATRPVQVRLVPVDAQSGVYGGISYDLPEARRTKVGAWTTLPTSTMLLRPGRGKVLSVTVHIPAETSPGQYIGGLTAFVPATTQSGQHFAVVVQTRLVLAIEITVPGRHTARLSLRGVDAAYRPDGVYILVHVRNTGTQLLAGEGTVRMTAAATKQLLLAGPLHVDLTVPGTGVAYPIRWMQAPSPGSYHAHTTICWKGGCASWDGLFTLGPPPTPKPGSGPGTIYRAAPPVGTTTAQDSTHMLVVILGGAVVLLLAVLILLLLLLLRRRQGNEHVRNSE